MELRYFTFAGKFKERDTLKAGKSLSLSIHENSYSIQTYNEVYTFKFSKRIHFSKNKIFLDQTIRSLVTEIL